MFALVAGTLTSTSLRSPRRNAENCRRGNGLINHLGKNLLPYLFVAVAMNIEKLKVTNNHCFAMQNSVLSKQQSAG